MERVGEINKRTTIAKKRATKTKSQQDEEKEKIKEEVRMSLTLKNSISIPDRGTLPAAANYYNKPPLYPCYLRATPAEER